MAKSIKNKVSKNHTRKNKKNTNEYVVAIPTYNRSDILAKKTLATLKSGKVDPKKIHIFVANKEEEAKYLEVVPRELYGKMIVGVKGITNQRRFISDYFPEGQEIVSLDDDIEGLYRRIDAKKLSQIRNLDGFFREAFQRARREGVFLWGIYPVCNPFFMKPNITTKLKFIIGMLHGYINRCDPKLRPSGKADQKEDVETSILYYLKDGGVLRYNNVGAKTKFHAPGGLGQTKDRIEANRSAAEYLSKQYPQYATMWTRPNGMAEVKLREPKNS